MIDTRFGRICRVRTRDGDARYACTDAKIRENRARIGSFKGKNGIRQKNAGRHGNGDILRSQESRPDWHRAGGRMFSQIDAFKLGGGFQPPFRVPKFPAGPFITDLNTRYGKTIAACIPARSEEHTSELQSLMRISYSVFCLKKKTKDHHNTTKQHQHHNTNTT